MVNFAKIASFSLPYAGVFLPEIPRESFPLAKLHVSLYYLVHAFSASDLQSFSPLFLLYLSSHVALSLFELFLFLMISCCCRFSWMVCFSLPWNLWKLSCYHGYWQGEVSWLHHGVMGPLVHEAGELSQTRNHSGCRIQQIRISNCIRTYPTSFKMALCTSKGINTTLRQFS